MGKELLWVFVGGGIGSVARYLLGRLVAGRVGETAFPWGTFIVNAVGCLLIGALAALLVRGCLSEHMRLMLIVGLCGGLTTFSTFSNEAVALLRSGHYAVFGVYVLASVVVGILSVVAGARIACR